jgi:hypothetical protein
LRLSLGSGAESFFFVNKKKQKKLCSPRAISAPQAPVKQKFLRRFFQKAAAFLDLPAGPVAPVVLGPGVGHRNGRAYCKSSDDYIIR